MQLFLGTETTLCAPSDAPGVRLTAADVVDKTERNDVRAVIAPL